MVLIWISILIITFIMFFSIIDFIRGGVSRGHQPLKDSKFSKELFYILLMIYLIVLIGFGLIYFLLSMDERILTDYEIKENITIFEKLLQSLYFSGVTLLTIGYGDVAPVGLGRFIAIVQALIGYILPTAFVLRIVHTNESRK